MRRSKQEAAASRARILAAAARLFRERGPQSVSVAEVMQAAGMTHGGFYKHFASKDDLLAAAITDIFAERRAMLAPAGSEEARVASRAFRADYLSPQHVANLGSGCPIAGLSVDALRASPGAAEALAEGTAAMLADLAAARGDTPEHADAALRDLIVMVGAIVLARAAGDPPTAARILEIAREATA